MAEAVASSLYKNTIMNIPSKLKKKLDTIVSVYQNNLGNVSATCKACGISRHTFYNYKNKYEAFAEELEATDEQNIDFAETMLLKNIREGKENSILFYLKTKGKNRGYVEKTEQEVHVNPFIEMMQSLPDETE